MRRSGKTAAGIPIETGTEEFALRFGRRVRDLRQQKGWTLEQLGRESGLSISALSKIENEQVTPSFDTLVKLSRAFGYSFEQFVRVSNEVYFASGLRTITNAGHGIRFSSAQYDYEVHSAELTHKRMIPLVIRIKTREPPPRQDWSSHDGEEFIYVVQGVVELHTQFYAPAQLGEGDSAYIDSSMRHAFVSVGESEAVMLSVCLAERCADRLHSKMPWPR
jgi:transcriptional regulator with XRE-family HTH domain